MMKCTCLTGWNLWIVTIMHVTHITMHYFMKFTKHSSTCILEILSTIIISTMSWTHDNSIYHNHFDRTCLSMRGWTSINNHSILSCKSSSSSIVYNQSCILSCKNRHLTIFINAKYCSWIITSDPVRSSFVLMCTLRTEVILSTANDTIFTKLIESLFCD